MPSAGDATAVTVTVAAAVIALLTGCGAPEPAAEPVGCEALLDGRGFAGHMLVFQESAPGDTRQVYCTFVDEQYRDAPAAVQVGGRRALYDPREDEFTEVPISVPVTGNFAQAPSAS